MSVRGLAVLVILICSATFAQIPCGRADPLYDRPVYDPASKSYFEMVLIRTTKYSYRNSPDVTWEEAYKLARERVYKGVRGQLAVVDSLASHEFLARTFQADNLAWIGLRYWCENRKVQFVNGQYWSRGMFSAWDQKWDQSGVKDPCGEYHSYRRHQYMPVAYHSVGGGFRWAAFEWNKAFYAYFVQYSTGPE